MARSTVRVQADDPKSRADFRWREPTNLRLLTPREEFGGLLLILCIRGSAFDSPSIALLRQYETEKLSLRVSAGARKVIRHCGAGVGFARNFRIGEERIHTKIGDPLILHVFLNHLFGF